MSFPIVTALTAAVIATLQQALMLSVGMLRAKYGQGIGDGGHEDLARRVRRHGNLAENSGLFLVVLALLELSGLGMPFLAALAGVFVVARFGHAWALTVTDGPHPLRLTGALGTVGATIVTALALGVRALTSLG